MTSNVFGWINPDYFPDGQTNPNRSPNGSCPLGSLGGRGALPGLPAGRGLGVLFVGLSGWGGIPIGDLPSCLGLESVFGFGGFGVDGVSAGFPSSFIVRPIRLRSASTSRTVTITF